MKCCSLLKLHTVEAMPMTLISRWVMLNTISMNIYKQCCFNKCKINLNHTK